MECVVIKADKRFREYDLDVIAAVNYSETREGKVIRLDIVPCTKNLRYKDMKCTYPFLIIPATMSDIFPDLVILGEVHSDLGVVNDWWTYRVDKGMLEMVLRDYFVRLKYIDILKKKRELERLLKRK